MKHFPFILLFSVSFLANAQKVSEPFDQLFYRENFDRANEIWAQRYTANELLLTEKGAYRMKRTSANMYTSVIPLMDDLPDPMRLETSLTLAKSADPEFSVGVLIMVQNQFSGAYLLEINNLRQYRIRKIDQGITSHPLGDRKNNYWIRHKSLNKKGKANKIAVHISGKQFDVYLNDKYVVSISDATFSSGTFGFMVNAGSEAFVDYVLLQKTEKEGPSDNSDNKSRPLQIDEENDGLQEIVLLFKTKLDQQQKQIEILERDLRNCRNQVQTDTAAESRIRELDKHNRELRLRVSNLEQQLQEKEGRLDYLESLKEDIEKSNNGDIILNLTQMLADEKRRNKALLEEIRKLKQGQ